MARKIGRVTGRVIETETTTQTTQSNRKLMRRILKNRLGSNKIAMAWYRMQVQRYGENDLQIIYSKNLPLRKRRAKSALYA